MTRVYDEYGAAYIEAPDGSWTRIYAVSFLDWWNGLSKRAQQKYLKTHSRTDSNYAVAVANQK